MHILQGRSAPAIDAPALTRHLASAERVLIDLGTGDGRFVQHAAASDPHLVAVGVDACREQLHAAPRRAPPNALFVIAAAERLPAELDGAATWLTVNFPWGSLLHGLLAGEAAGAIARLARPGACVEVRLNAGALAEAGVSLEDGAERVRQALRDAGFTVRRPAWWGAAELRVFPSTWARRLAFGRDARAVELRALRSLSRWPAIHRRCTTRKAVSYALATVSRRRRPPAPGTHLHRKEHPMRLQLLGTGSPAPLPHRQGPAALLSFEGRHLLVDAGRGVTTQLVRAGVAPHELTAILLTHHNYDHIGNLGDLLLTAWHGGATDLPVLGPPGTDAIVSALFEQVYARELRFSLALAAATGEPLRPIGEVVRVTIIDDGHTVQQPGWQVSARAMVHGHSLGLSHHEWPCLGYRIAAGGGHVAFSGDTVACPALLELAQGADLLVQCCHRAAALNTSTARRLIAERVIAGSEQAGRIAAAANVKRLVLTHFSDMTPADLAAVVADVRRDYQGALDLGEDLLEIRL